MLFTIIALNRLTRPFGGGIRVVVCSQHHEWSVSVLGGKRHLLAQSYYGRQIFRPEYESAVLRVQNLTRKLFYIVFFFFE